MTGLWTVIIGVTAFVLGQAILRFVLDPIQEQRRVLGEIASAHVFFANVSSGTAGESEIAAAEATLRSLASRLRSTMWTIPVYSLWAALRMIPSKAAIRTASTSLIGWSNSVGTAVRGPHRTMLGNVLRLPDD